MGQACQNYGAYLRRRSCIVGAGASIDDDGGFFSELPSHAELPSLELNIGGIDYHLRFRIRPDHPDGWATENREFPLIQRAWCFQERLLSRRFLCFGNKEILWECMEEVVCPCLMEDDRLFNRRDPKDQFAFGWSESTKANMHDPPHGQILEC